MGPHASRQAAQLLHSVLADSGMSKSELCRVSGVSRSLLDDYLHGAKQPSIPQLERLASAADLRITWDVSRTPQRASPEFLMVMELAEAMPHDSFAPLEFPSLMQVRR